MNSSFFSILRYPRVCLQRRPTQFMTTSKPAQPNPIRTFSNHPSKTMASQDVLATKLKALSVASLPKYPNCYPEVNPVDIYRAHLTEILTEVTGVDAAIVYPALQWTQTLEKGDLVLPVPALRVKGKKPPELAAQWVENVCQSSPILNARPSPNSMLSRSFLSRLSCTSPQ